MTYKRAFQIAIDAINDQMDRYQAEELDEMREWAKEMYEAISVLEQLTYVCGPVH